MVIDTNQKAFFALLRAGLWGKEVRLFPLDSFGLSEVYNLASEQAVLGLVAAGIDYYKAKGSQLELMQEWTLQLIGETLQLEEMNKSMNKFIAGLINRLCLANINAILVKGQGLAQCYERPLWRGCGDVDLLLDAKNYEKAKQYLIPLAESVESEDSYCKHIGMTINSWVVELHGSLHTELSSRIDKKLDEIQNDTTASVGVRIWDNGDVKVLLPKVDNDVIFVFTHFLKHFYKGGLGLRQICDWSRLLWTYKNTIDVDLLEKRLCSMKLMTEWKAFGAFSVEYLGMPIEAMPLYDNTEKWTRKADRIMSFVLMTGNMGHNRDMSFYSEKNFLVKKSMSAYLKISDLVRHALIFPLDSFRFLPNLMFHGMKSAIKEI